MNEMNRDELLRQIQVLEQLKNKKRGSLNSDLEAKLAELKRRLAENQRNQNDMPWGPPKREPRRLPPPEHAQSQPQGDRKRVMQNRSRGNNRRHYRQTMSSFENQARQVVSSTSPLFKWGVLEAVAIFFSLAFVSQIWGTLWMFVALWAVTLFFGYIFKPKSRGASSAKALAFVFAPLIGTAITFFSTSAGMSIITTGAILISGWKSLNDDRMSARVIDDQDIDDSEFPRRM